MSGTRYGVRAVPTRYSGSRNHIAEASRSCSFGRAPTAYIRFAQEAASSV
jgi:hypothetical protein